MLLPSMHCAYTMKQLGQWSEVQFLRTAVKLLADERERYQRALYEMVKVSPLPAIALRDNKLWTPELISECLHQQE